MRALDTLDAEAIRRWALAALGALRARQGEIDRINVFPVADADTGSNLVLTLAGGIEALAEVVPAPDSAAAALGHLARGAVFDARGNSGVIFSQLLRGMAESASRGPGPYGAEQLRAGLAEGVSQAYGSVSEPVEGTILTVARAAAEGLPAPPAGLADLARAAVLGADAALGRTPELLADLARAGVVDAGGQGLVVILDELARTITGGPSLLAGPPASCSPDPAGAAPVGARETGSTAFEYEVQYLLDAPEAAVAALRSTLATLGDSVALAGTGSGTWNVHAHVNDVGAAIEAGMSAGAVGRINVVRFADSPGAGVGTGVGAAGASVVASGIGPELAHLFAREGVSVVEPGPSGVEAAVLAAIRAGGAGRVVLLANGQPAAAGAQAAARAARADGIRVAVVPTRSPVQALAAVAVHDPGRDFDGDVVAMAEAAAATRFAQVRVAEEQALTSVGICQAGEVLGLVDGEVVEIGHGLLPVAFSLAARLAALGVELMTILVGPGAPPGVGQLLTEHVGRLSPLTEVAVYPAGADACPLTIGVE